MIGFRVDANETIATGHLMRCMAIAKGFRKKGEEVMFFLAEEKEIKRLKEQDLPYVILHSDWRNLEQELPVFKQVLTQYPVTKLIVDSYQATRHYLESLNQNVKSIYMDDMGTEYYPIAGVIHYSNWPWDTAYEKRYENMDTICMAGMQYTPLREEFYPKEDCVDEECSKEDYVNEFYPKEDYVDEVCLKKDYVGEVCSKKKYMDEECSKKNYVDEVDSKEEYLKEENIENTDREKNILITTGGTDPYNIAGRLLAYAKTQMECQSDMGKMFSKAHFLVISGSMNQNKPFLEKFAKENHWIILYENVNNMGELMRKSDFAISAGGTTLYELCACKVPAVCFSFADNQAGFTKEMGKQGIMCDAGDAREQGNVCGAGDARKQGSVCDDAGDVRKQSGVCDTEDTREQDSFIKNIYKQLMKLWNDEQLCGRYREKMGQLVDGKGVERIVEKIQEM